LLINSLTSAQRVRKGKQSKTFSDKSALVFLSLADVQSSGNYPLLQMALQKQSGLVRKAYSLSLILLLKETSPLLVYASLPSPSSCIWNSRGTGSLLPKCQLCISFISPLDIVGFPQGPVLALLFWLHLIPQALKIFKAHL
jgi:hypothetical protein